MTEAMTEAFGRVRTAEITYAAPNSDFGGFAIQQGTTWLCWSTSSSVPTRIWTRC